MGTMVRHRRPWLKSIGILSAFPVVLGSCQSPEVDGVRLERGPAVTTTAPVSLARSGVEAASAFEITEESQLIGGPAAQGRFGDFMLQNSYVRAIIQQPGFDAGAGPLGGNLIDADLVRASGEPGQDSFGELNLFFNIDLTLGADDVHVLDNGATSGIAKVEACGMDALYDFVDMGGLLEEQRPGVHWLFPYQFNHTFGIQICTEYALGAEDRFVRITTTFYNETGDDIFTPVGDIVDSGGDNEQFLPNPTGEQIGRGDSAVVYGGFGENVYAPLDFLGFFAPNVAYAYAAPTIDGERVDAMQVSISGVTVTVVGTDKLFPVLHQVEPSLTLIPAGGSASVEREFVIGADLAEVTDEVYRMRNQPVGTVQGTVTESSTNVPLAGVRVTVVSQVENWAPLTQFYTDANGQFRGNLPAGSYALIAAEGFYFMDDGRPEIQTPQIFSVNTGQTVTKNLAMSRTGSVSLSAKDGSDSTGKTLIPAKVLFFGQDSTAPIAPLMDIVDDFVDDTSSAPGLVRMVYLTSGSATVNVKPGTYDIVFTRGFEYDVKVIQDVAISSGSTTTVSAVLTRVLDTSGYISGDLHVHSINSPDSPIPHINRVASFVTEGVEVLVATDHDFVTDFRPVIDDMAASRYITSIVGEEVTTWVSGHFNVFPLVEDSESRTGGAVNWMNNQTNCITFDTDSDWQDNLTVPQIFDVAQTCLGANDVLVRQINHPRYEFQGYFGQLGLNLAAYGTANEYTAEPADFRMPDGEDLFDPTSFNTLEIQNEGNVGAATTVMNDWFGLIHLGFPKSGSGVSDTHTEVKAEAGYGRTYVKVSNDSPSSAHSNSAFPAEFSESMAAGHASAGIGAFVTASAVPTSGGTTVGMGEMVTNSGGRATVSVRIQNPLWVNYKRVDLYVNPIVFANSDNATYIDPSGLSPLYTYCNSLYDDGSCRNDSSDAGTFVSNFTPSSVAIPSAGGSTGRQEATLSIPVTVSQDAWVVAIVWDGRTEAYSGHGDNTLVFTNPIYIDANNDGRWTAPCANYNANIGCQYLRPVSERPGDIISSERTVSAEEAEMRKVSEVFAELFGRVAPTVR